MSTHDQELEALLAELAPTPEARAALLEEHRLLEHDLSRLSDPLPPPDFLAQVMARVDAEPARAPSRAELASGLFISLLAAAASVAAFVMGGLPAGLGQGALEVLLRGREAAVGVSSGALAVWRLAPLPVVAALAMAAVAGVVLMRRLAVAQPGMKVS